MSETERRQKTEDRVKVHIEVDLESYNQYALSRLENISIGGAFISTQDLKSVGTELHNSFKLPDDSRDIKAEATDVWAYRQRGRTEANASGMGLKFTSITDEDRQRIRAFIEKNRDVF